MLCAEGLYLSPLHFQVPVDSILATGKALSFGQQIRWGPLCKHSVSCALHLQPEGPPGLWAWRSQEHPLLKLSRLGVSICSSLQQSLRWILSPTMNQARQG